VLYDMLEGNSDVNNRCAEFEGCHIVPSGKNNILGELKSGYARIKGPLTTLTAVAQKYIGHTSQGRACTVRLLEHRHVYAGVYFDVDTYETCDVVMITPGAGLALRPVDGRKGTYVRVGALSVYMSEGVVDDKGDPVSINERLSSLSPSDYPEPTSVTLL
jgi:hypothetical protein